MVPHLVTALNGPINELEQHVLDAMPAIERWFRLEWMEHTPPFYCAADLRNAGFKLAPVDIELYPEGWDHLSEDMLPLAVQAAQAAIEKICPEARNLLLVPRNRAHTDNFYLRNLVQLMRIFQNAGLNVRLGSIDPALRTAKKIKLPDGQVVQLDPVIRSKRRLELKHFDPCTIVLNNDLASGIPGILEELNEQYLLPPLHASSVVRRKSNYLRCYDELTKRFGKLLGIDPWLIDRQNMHAKTGDLTQAGALDALAQSCDAVLAKIRRKYKEYRIREKPFVTIQADGSGKEGTVLTLHDAREIAALDRQTRARLSARPMSSIDGEDDGPQDHEEIPSFVVQEGVPNGERIHDNVAEPVVYMMDRYVVGGLYRIHAQQQQPASDKRSGLSAPAGRKDGAHFVPLAFSERPHLPQPGAKPGASVPNRFYMYGVLARLAMVAVSYELEATDPDAETYA
ncbi:MAG: glutamate--cysteine ligase [Burkholderiaceae bacterium]|jgi:glutamate--cysteine ligase|nr:glutamate--cysteine ligase [Burkholderiaceae bacterium]